MAPRPNSAFTKRSTRQSITDPRKQPPVVEPTRSSARLRQKQSSTANAPAFQAAGTRNKRLQQDSKAKIDEPRGVRPTKQSTKRNTKRNAKRKRPQDSETKFKAEAEDVRPSKKPREPLPSESNEQKLSPPMNPLSERNLKLFNSKEMDLAAVLGHKRTSSQRSIGPSETGTERTQRSSNTNAIYRHRNLAAVEIHMHVEPPDYIQAAINRIFTAEVSTERRSKLRLTAQELRDNCLQNVGAYAGEDDFMNSLCTALKALGLENLCIHWKADWQAELKPVAPPQSHFNSRFISGTRQLEVDNVSAPLSTGKPSISRESSIPNTPIRTLLSEPPESSTAPTVASPGSLIKTPRPDISIGIQIAALISDLSSQNLNKAQARKFLTWLQNKLVQHKADRPFEPILTSVPAPRALNLAFPFAVVEGKAYSTGKQIFEAENQAAVSAACALKIQLTLDNLVDRGATASSDPRLTTNTTTTSNIDPPLFFAICTQGPIHELWAHWTVVDEDGVCTFGSKLLDSCNVLLLQQGEDFLVRLYNVGCWGLGPFMTSVVERLGKVAEKAQA
ncbi:hypothetical protein EV356DRAFT_501412 [Viridothelium virens]|uniref:Uncharacterized protein n=1 Tax=Viridothelium virens TaxID=1048519 RepID=A0A6A6HAN0_VIRVR|nr:hypothetical protein EV356DRAFT_501412 [Viridothelium virens]